MNEFMKISKDLANENLKSNEGGPFGACVVKNGKVIGSGSNKVLLTNDPTAHAEIMAIRDACKNINSYDLSGCEMYINCFPCPMCLSAIIWSNIKTIYYGNTKEDAMKLGFKDNDIYKYFSSLCSDDKVIKLIQIDRDETIKEFQNFEKKKDKTIY